MTTTTVVLTHDLRHHDHHARRGERDGAVGYAFQYARLEPALRDLLGSTR